MRRSVMCAIFSVAVIVACPALVAGDTLPPLPWLGLAFTWTESQSRAPMLHVRRVTAGGPAEQGGVRPGDLVTAMNGERVDFGDELEFLLFLQAKKPGRQLRLTIVRDGREREVAVILGVLPKEQRGKWERNLNMARAARARRERARE
jgi:S1-C subfamily serine protease